MNKCKWCNTELYKLGYSDYDFDKILDIDGDNLTVLSMLWNSKLNKYALCAGGESETIVNINYCPGCGRKL